MHSAVCTKAQLMHSDVCTCTPSYGHGWILITIMMLMTHVSVIVTLISVSVIVTLISVIVIQVSVSV